MYVCLYCNWSNIILEVLVNIGRALLLLTHHNNLSSEEDTCLLLCINEMILMIASWLILTPIIIILFKYIHHLLNLHCYPTGPFPLPLLGNLHLLTDKPYQELRKCAKMYGDVFSFSMGFKRLVIINSYEAFREALVEKNMDFAGRPNRQFPH